jgi:hypothetical protein
MRHSMVLTRGSAVAALLYLASASACTSAPDLHVETNPPPTSISDRGVQEHGKVWPRSIDSAYMGTWGDNRNSGSTLVTSFEQRRLAGQSEYLSWTQPNSPPVSALMTNGSTEAPNGLVIAVSPRGGGTSTVVALDLNAKVAWRTEEWTGEDNDGDGTPDRAGMGNAVASSAGIQAPMVDEEGALYVADNYGVWKLDQDTGERIWFSRFSDYSGNKLASNDLRLLNEGEDGLVGNVFASGWHIWLDRRDGSPVIVKEPDAFSANDCPLRSRMYLSVGGGEMDKSGELDELVCLAYDANNTTPQPNNLAVRPAIPGVSEHARYVFTYAGPPGQPDSSRLIAYDFTYSEEEGWGVRKAWERVVAGLTAASPTMSPDYAVVNGSDADGNVNFTHVETGESLPKFETDFNSFGSPFSTIDGLFCDAWTQACISPDGKTTIQADHSVAEQIAAQVLPELDDYAIPFLWGTTPDADYIGGMVVDPVRWTVTASVGYPYFLGTVLGTFTRLGNLTPTAMVPVTFDATTGKLMPGQTFGPELVRPGISQANAMVTTRGRYVVQKAELLTLFFYYLFQGNYNFFNTNDVAYDDVSESELDELREKSAELNFFGLFGPIDEEGVVPEAWKVPQPEAGLTIYEPTSFLQGVRNQVEMDIGLVDFALANLCVTAGCDIEEAAARLGYATWNLERAVIRQLAEAETRTEIGSEARRSLDEAASAAAGLCRRARVRILADQPRLPNAEALVGAGKDAEACRADLLAIRSRLADQ